MAQILDKNKGKISLLIASILLCIIIFELLLRLNLISAPYINSDGWWRENWLKHPNWCNPDKDMENYSIDKFDSRLGCVPNSNVRNFSMDSAIINTNSQGIRGIKEYPIERNDKVRILTLGDSFTLGLCVNDNETFSSYLEESYNNSEVINMGMYGYGNDQQLLKLEYDGLKYKPDIIILGFINNDINRNALSFRDSEKQKFDLKDGKLYLKNPFLPSLDSLKGPFNLRIFNYLEMFRDWLLRNEIELRNLEISYKIFERMKADADSINSTLILVYLPGVNETISNESNPDKLFYYLCNDKNISCIDPTSRIHSFLEDKENPNKYFACHYSKEIHKLVAEEIYDSLNKSSDNMKIRRINELYPYSSPDKIKYIISFLLKRNLSGFYFISDSTDRLIGKFGIFLKEHTSDLYYKLKKIKGDKE